MIMLRLWKGCRNTRVRACSCRGTRPQSFTRWSIHRSQPTTPYSAIPLSTSIHRIINAEDEAAVRERSSDEPYGEDFGDYDIILPPDPPIWGLSHVSPRSIPPYILRPPYVLALERKRGYTLAECGRNLGKPPAEERSADARDVLEDDGFHHDPYDGDGRIDLGGKDEARLRNAAALAKKALLRAGELVRVGTTTNEIDAALHDFIVSNNAYPSPLHYAGFPRSCCTSVNNIVVHGIPDDRELRDGDIVNVDVTVYLNEFHGDTSQTFLVGDVDDQGRDLVQAANDALEGGIGACGPGRPFKAIGAAIHDIASKRGYSISSQFSGHGIGRVFHRPPWILHHRNDEPGTMLPGHCFTIEPCVIQGADPRAWIFPDGWAASTENCARSAQAEHMVLITHSGVDILTR